MNASLEAWLYDLEHRHVREIQLGLERVQKVAADLGLDIKTCPVITVAGTNGKGSTVAMLEAIYVQAGFRVGAYTSPHLVSFNERIRLHQKPIDEQRLVSTFEKLENQRKNISLTYFEFVTLAALMIFKEEALDVVILEVGLGGRLDATNVIDPDLAIITTIDYDHQAYLGHTLEQIGAEKAGIMRPNITCIYGDVHPPQSILDRARDLGVKLLIREQDFNLVITNKTLNLSFSAAEVYQFNQSTLHESAVAVAVVATRTLQNKLPVGIEVIDKAIQSTKLAGRLQWIEGPVPILLDVAHNPQSVELLANKIKSLRPQGKVIAVFSAFKDKDIEEMVKKIAGEIDVFNLFEIDSPRAATIATLRSALSCAKHLQIYHHENVKKAFENARQQAENGDMIVVFGSFLVVGPLMAEFDFPLEVE